MTGERHKVAETDQLAEDGSRLVVELRGKEIGVFRVGDEYHAMANFCPHQLGPLCEGETTGYMTMDGDGVGWRFVDDGTAVACPWHGWKFDVRDGSSLQSERYVVPTYEVDVEGGEIFVRLP